MAGLAEFFVIGLEQLQVVCTVGQMASPTLPFFEWRMGYGVRLGLYLMTREASPSEIGGQQIRCFGGMGGMTAKATAVGVWLVHESFFCLAWAMAAQAEFAGR